MKIKIHKSETN